MNAYASEPTEEPKKSSSSDENESSSSSEDTQTLFQNIAGTATKFSARFSGNSIILNNAPSGLYTIGIFDVQGNKVIRISQGKRTLGMTRAIKQK